MRSLALALFASLILVYSADAGTPIPPKGATPAQWAAHLAYIATLTPDHGPTTVWVDGEFAGKDPDPRVRQMLLADFYRKMGDVSGAAGP